jgi:eukaryotic-like serine/threonine-protein kinase
LKKYILSPQYAFLKKEDINNLDIPEVQKVMNEELFALHDTVTDGILLLPPAIHEFLCFFSTPLSFKQVIEKYVALTSETPETVEQAIEPFFGDMFHRGIIMLEKWAKEAKPQTLSVKDTFGRYEVTEIFSDEAALKICLALDLTDNKKVVLKILDKRERVSKRDLNYWVKRFKQEADILKEAEHPSVCGLLEVFETDTAWVSVMEHVEGDSLRHWIKGIGENDFPKKRQIFEQITAAYAHLHTKKILHGDIHRSNVLITKNNIVKLIDFDMSYHQPLRRSELVIEGGVHEYLPPEKISDSFFDLVNDRADFRSEVYQIGVLGYFIFYGKLPHKGDTWQDLAKAIREEEPELGRFEEEEDDIDQLLRQALAKKPEKRFKSAIPLNEYMRRINQIKSQVEPMHAV